MPTTASCERHYWPSAFYRWANWSPEKLTNLSKVIQPAVCRAGTWPQVALDHHIDRLVKSFSDLIRTHTFRSHFLWEGFNGLDYKVQDQTTGKIFRFNLCSVSVWDRLGSHLGHDINLFSSVLCCNETRRRKMKMKSSWREIVRTSKKKWAWCGFKGSLVTDVFNLAIPCFMSIQAWTGVLFFMC